MRGGYNFPAKKFIIRYLLDKQLVFENIRSYWEGFTTLSFYSLTMLLLETGRALLS